MFYFATAGREAIDLVWDTELYGDLTSARFEYNLGPCSLPGLNLNVGDPD